MTENEPKLKPLSAGAKRHIPEIVAFFRAKADATAGRGTKTFAVALHAAANELEREIDVVSGGVDDDGE